MIRLIPCLAALVLIPLFQASGQTLTAKEKQIVKSVDKLLPESVPFLEKTVNINSGTQNLEGVKATGQLYQTEFDKLGFTTRWVSMPTEMKRAGHLFAEHRGKKGKRILLIGHLDTVFEPNSPFQRFTLQDSIAYGPGANDMKGGNMILLFALKALKDAGALNDAQVIVALHGDEESTGKPLDISRRDIIEAAQRSDVALAFETATGYDYATVARRGSSGWKIESTGKQAHSSGIFNENIGAGSVYEASRILTAFYQELKEENLTYNPGLILGGTTVQLDAAGTAGQAFGKTNVIAPTTVVHGDLRCISPEQLERVRAKMVNIVKASLPQTHSTIVFGESYPSMPPTEGNLALLKKLNQVSLDLNQGEVKAFDPAKRGAGDISFVAQYVDCLDGLGAMGGGAHSNQEYVDLRTLGDLIKRSALLIYRLTQPEKTTLNRMR